MDRRMSTSSDALLVHSSSPMNSRDYLNAPSSSQYLNAPKAQSVRSENRYSYNRLDVDPVSAPSFCLTPPTRSATPEHAMDWMRDEMIYHHRGELTMVEKYNYDLAKAQLKASSRTSALLSGFAMIALVELQYNADTPHGLLITLGVVTALLVSVHLLALMMSTCILPYMEAAGATRDSPHNRLKFYINLTWFFSTCVGLILFLIEIGLIFYIKFQAIGYERAGWITSAILLPVLFIFVIISCFLHKSRISHSIYRIDRKVNHLRQLLAHSEKDVTTMKIV